MYFELIVKNGLSFGSGYRIALLPHFVVELCSVAMVKSCVDVHIVNIKYSLPYLRWALTAQLVANIP